MLNHCHYTWVCQIPFKSINFPFSILNIFIWTAALKACLLSSTSDHTRFHQLAAGPQFWVSSDSLSCGSVAQAYPACGHLGAGLTPRSISHRAIMMKSVLKFSNISQTVTKKGLEKGRLRHVKVLRVCLSKHPSTRAAQNGKWLGASTDRSQGGGFYREVAEAKQGNHWLATAQVVALFGKAHWLLGIHCSPVQVHGLWLTRLGGVWATCLPASLSSDKVSFMMFGKTSWDTLSKFSINI